MLLSTMVQYSNIICINELFSVKDQRLCVIIRLFNRHGASVLNIVFWVFVYKMLLWLDRFVYQWLATRKKVHWTTVNRVNHDWLQLYSNNSLISSRLQENGISNYTESFFALPFFGDSFLGHFAAFELSFTHFFFSFVVFAL